MRIANPFRYQFKEPYMSVSCVYKAWFGKKYLIVYGKALHQSVNQISIELDRRLRLGFNEESIYFNVLKHIGRGRVALMLIDMIKQTDEPLELLKTTYTLLQKSKKDPDCLNMTFDPYVPQWIPETDKLAFEKWKITQAKKKPIQPRKIKQTGKRPGTAKKSAPAQHSKATKASSTTNRTRKNK